MPYLEASLTTLNLSVQDLNGLTDEEKRTKIRNAYLRKVLHEKNPKVVTRLLQAYISLTQRPEADIPLEIRRELSASDPTRVPTSTFNMLMEEQVLAREEALFVAFSSLKTDAAKIRFFMEHLDFLKLANELRRASVLSNGLRLEQKLKNGNRLKEILLERWRTEVIGIYGEENLDDFQYRHALATGNLYPILATRKLLNPIKLPAVISFGLGLLSLSSLIYYLSDILLPLLKSITDRSRMTRLQYLSTMSKLLFNLSVVGLFSYLTFAYSPYIVIGLSLPILLQKLSCPINTFIRPLAQYSGQSPILLSGLLIAAAVGAGVLAYGTTITVATLLPITLILFGILETYRQYLDIKLCQNAFKIDPLLGLLPAVNLVLNLIGIAAAIVFFYSGFSLLLGTISVSEPIIAFNMLLDAMVIRLAQTIFLNGLNQVALSVLNKDDIAINAITRSPEPKKDDVIPESVKTAYLKEIKTTYCSQQFFNTAKEASYLEPQKRTFLQKTASFFGGGTQSVQPGCEGDSLPSIAAMA